jgi:hypothetical protein
VSKDRCKLIAVLPPLLLLLSFRSKLLYVASDQSFRPGDSFAYRTPNDAFAKGEVEGIDVRVLVNVVCWLL